MTQEAQKTQWQLEFNFWNIFICIYNKFISDKDLLFKLNNLYMFLKVYNIYYEKDQFVDCIS